MVILLRGKVDGKDVIFEKITESQWNATVPKELSGFYVIELEAYDEAGNRAYTTKFLLTFDPSALYLKLEPCDYQASLVATEYLAQASLSQYFGVLRT